MTTTHSSTEDLDIFVIMSLVGAILGVIAYTVTSAISGFIFWFF